MADSIKNLYTKLFEIQGIGVSKDGLNPHFKSSYVTLDNIIVVLNPILKANKLLVTHYTQNKEVVTAVVDTESGELLESRFPLIEDNNPQKLGSCITYAKRYNLVQLFNISTNEDDDANKSSGTTKKKEDHTQEITPPDFKI